MHCCRNKAQKFALVNLKCQLQKKQVEQVCHFCIFEFVFNHGHNYRRGKKYSVVVLVIFNLMCTIFRPGKKLINVHLVMRLHVSNTLHKSVLYYMPSCCELILSSLQ